jgi:endothelin-converting enzyme/putative endopeptidase
MRMLNRCLAAAGLLAASCLTALAAEGGKPILGSWGVETQHISPTVKPGDDFYRHVNGGWLKDAKPPPGMPYANAFVDAFMRTQGHLDELFTRLLASPQTPGSDEHLVASLYQSYLDTDRRNSLGLAPLRAELDAILAISSHEDIARWMGKPFVASIISVGVATDARNPQRYVLSSAQSGLGLPTPEYYLTPGEPFAGHRTAYRAHIESTLSRAGVPDAAKAADAILALEVAIAGLHWTGTEKRDPVRAYNLMKVADLGAYAPGYPWASMLDGAGLKDQTEIVLTTDTAIQKLAALFASTPVETLRTYLAFHYVDRFASSLGEDWEGPWFAFYGTRLSGTPQPLPLKTRAAQFVSGQLGEVLGKLYVASYFPPDYREQMDSLVLNLRTAFKARLEANTWMDEPTRKEALAKLEAIVSHVGYPDTWRDYSSVNLDPTDLVGNMRRIAEWDKADMIKALGEPRRDWMWGYPAMEINAGYSPSNNSITFPAGILQSPFFDPFADPAVNYGAIGAVIGHEIGHAFDDQGSQSDGTGALRDWWTPAARAEFNKRTAILVEQFNGYEIDGMKVNGQLTLGENIGDLGGLFIGYEAYRMFVAKEQGGNAPVIDGFTGDQRFFLSWAQLWRNVTTPDQQRANLLGDVHSPGEFRANGSVRNFDPWYEAFGVKEGDALYIAPEKRVKIW